MVPGVPGVPGAPETRMYLRSGYFLVTYNAAFFLSHPLKKYLHIQNLARISKFVVDEIFLAFKTGKKYPKIFTLIKMMLKLDNLSNGICSILNLHTANVMSTKHLKCC